MSSMFGISLKEGEEELANNYGWMYSIRRWRVEDLGTSLFEFDGSQLEGVELGEVRAESKDVQTHWLRTFGFSTRSGHGW